LDWNEDVLRGFPSAEELKDLLKGVKSFVNQCSTDSNVIQTVWEAIWKKRLPRMLEEMSKWALYLTLESSVSQGLLTVLLNLKLVY
jgi:hypothetical protein